MKQSSFLREDRNDCAEYIRDSITQPKSVVDAKVKTAFKNGNLDYYFQSLSKKDRSAKLKEHAASFSDTDYWHYVRRFWVNEDDFPSVLALILSDRPNRELLMREHERLALQKLPSEVLIYRGCEKDVPHVWWAWTIDEEVARMFAAKYKGEGEGTILRGRCQKADIVALFDCNGYHESEVIVNPEKVFSLEQRYAAARFTEDRVGKAGWRPV